MTFVLILLLLYTQMFLILWFSWLEKERKNQFKSETPRLLKLSVFLKPPPLTIPTAPPPRLLVFDIFSNRPYIPPPPLPSIRDLRVRKLKGRGKPFKVINRKFDNKYFLNKLLRKVANKFLKKLFLSLVWLFCLFLSTLTDIDLCYDKKFMASCVHPWCIFEKGASTWTVTILLNVWKFTKAWITSRSIVATIFM